MFTPEEIRNGVTGSWRLLLGDPQGLLRFDVTTAGFYRSFGVILLLAVPFVIAGSSERALILETRGIGAEAFPNVAFWIVQTIGFTAGWFAFAVVLAPLARPLGLARTYARLVIARNWSATIGVVPYVVPMLLHLLGFLTTEDFSAFMLAALVFNMGLAFQVTRLAAETSLGLTAALVVLDVLLTMVIGVGVDRIAGL